MFSYPEMIYLFRTFDICRKTGYYYLFFLRSVEKYCPLMGTDRSAEIVRVVEDETVE